MNTPSTCPHFSLCSGCTLADPLHPPIWEEALSFFRQYGIEPPLLYNGFNQTRLKAKLAVRKGPEIGLFKKNTHQVISIPDCLVHHTSINQAVAIIQKEMVQCQVIPYQENPPRGTLRYIQLFVERSTGKVQLTLITNQDGLDSFCQALLKNPIWHSIWINLQPHSSNRILGDSWKLVYGEPFLWQTIDQTSIPFHPGAFSQAHLSLFEKMIQKIKTWLQPTDHILELYAGVGAIGLCIRSLVKEVTLIENNPYAHLSFQETKSDISYLCMDASKANLSGYDLIIVDPPRKGLDPEMIPKLDASRLIYISCGFESFQRDAQALLSLGWKIREAEGYLFFPGTNHVETLALFEKM
jgi:23S rRNA (uracil1939-C5)-methyltransferase